MLEGQPQQPQQPQEKIVPAPDKNQELLGLPTEIKRSRSSLESFLADLDLDTEDTHPDVVMVDNQEHNISEEEDTIIEPLRFRGDESDGDLAEEIRKIDFSVSAEAAQLRAKENKKRGLEQIEHEVSEAKRAYTLAIDNFNSAGYGYDYDIEEESSRPDLGLKGLWRRKMSSKEKGVQMENHLTSIHKLKEQVLKQERIGGMIRKDLLDIMQKMRRQDSEDVRVVSPPIKTKKLNETKPDRPINMQNGVESDSVRDLKKLESLVEGVEPLSEEEMGQLLDSSKRYFMLDPMRRDSDISPSIKELDQFDDQTLARLKASILKGNEDAKVLVSEIKRFFGSVYATSNARAEMFSPEELSKINMLDSSIRSLVDFKNRYFVVNHNEKSKIKNVKLRESLRKISEDWEDEKERVSSDTGVMSERDIQELNSDMVENADNVVERTMIIRPEREISVWRKHFTKFHNDIRGLDMDNPRELAIAIKALTNIDESAFARMSETVNKYKDDKKMLDKIRGDWGDLLWVISSIEKGVRKNGEDNIQGITRDHLQFVEQVKSLLRKYLGLSLEHYITTGDIELIRDNTDSEVDDSPELASDFSEEITIQALNNRREVYISRNVLDTKTLGITLRKDLGDMSPSELEEFGMELKQELENGIRGIEQRERNGEFSSEESADLSYKKLTEAYERLRSDLLNYLPTKTEDYIPENYITQRQYRIRLVEEEMENPIPIEIKLDDGKVVTIDSVITDIGLVIVKDQSGKRKTINLSQDTAYTNRFVEILADTRHQVESRIAINLSTERQRKLRKRLKLDDYDEFIPQEVKVIIDSEMEDLLVEEEKKGVARFISQIFRKAEKHRRNIEDLRALAQ